METMPKPTPKKIPIPKKYQDFFTARENIYADIALEFKHLAADINKLRELDNIIYQKILEKDGISGR